MLEHQASPDKNPSLNEQHRKAWLQYALQTPQPYPKQKQQPENLFEKIFRFLSNLD